MSSVQWERKRATDNRKATSFQERDTGFIGPEERRLLGVKCRLSHRKWANGMLGSRRVGRRGEGVKSKQIREWRRLRLGDQRLVTKAPMSERGSYPDCDR